MALAFFADKGIDVSLDDGGVCTTDGRIFGLEPLRRRLTGVDSEEWEQAVDTHFSLLLEVDPAMPVTFARAAGALRSAVIGEGDLGLFDDALMERKLVDGLGERMMLRRGPLGMTVTTATVEEWGVEPERVWERARRGSIWDEPVEAHEVRVGEAIRFRRVCGGRWTSTHVLDLDRHVGATTSYGALVAVPARDEILIHEISDSSFADAALAMLSFSHISFAESPLPVGLDLFWWSGSGLHRICRPGDERYEYIRVPEFSSMLWRLEEALGATVRPRHDSS